MGVPSPFLIYVNSFKLEKYWCFFNGVFINFVLLFIKCYTLCLIILKYCQY